MKHVTVATAKDTRVNRCVQSGGFGLLSLRVGICRQMKNNGANYAKDGGMALKK